MSDNPGEDIPDVKQEEEVVERKPLQRNSRLSKAEYDTPETIESNLKDYEGTIMEIQKILLWKRPTFLFVFVAVLDVLLLCAHFYDIGIIAFIMLCVFVFYVSVSVYNLFRPFFDNLLFSSKNETTENDTRLRSFEEICDLIATWKSKLISLINVLIGRKFGSGIIRIVITAGIWIGIGFVIKYIGNIWFLILALDAILLVPGFLLSPRNQEQLEVALKEHTD